MSPTPPSLCGSLVVKSKDCGLIWLKSDGYVVKRSVVGLMMGLRVSRRWSYMAGVAFTTFFLSKKNKIFSTILFDRQRVFLVRVSSLFVCLHWPQSLCSHLFHVTPMLILFSPHRFLSPLTFLLSSAFSLMVQFRLLCLCFFSDQYNIVRTIYSVSLLSSSAHDK